MSRERAVEFRQILLDGGGLRERVLTSWETKRFDEICLFLKISGDMELGLLEKPICLGGSAVSEDQYPPVIQSKFAGGVARCGGSEIRSV
ncbi:MAG: hypothetical protein ACKON9_29825, partial [Planctomycetaceae bacterium]